MDRKKSKLTISGNPKKSIDNFELAKLQNKNSVVIEKKPSRFPNRSPFIKGDLFGNLLGFFSITTEFLFCNFANSKLSIDFLGFPEIVNFDFFLSIFHFSIFINFISC